MAAVNVNALQLTASAGDCSGETCTGQKMFANYAEYFCASVNPTSSSCTGYEDASDEEAVEEENGVDTTDDQQCCIVYQNYNYGGTS